MGLFDLVDVGLCRWWVCLIWWMSGVGCGFVPVMDVGLFGLVDVGLCQSL